VKTFIIIVAFCTTFISVNAQSDTTTLKKSVYTHLDSIISIFNRKDWLRLMDYMHPNLIEFGGGKTALSELIGAQMEAANAEIVVYKPGKLLQLIKTETGYQGVVESLMQMKVMGNMVSGTSYDLIMSDDGLKWSFTRIDEPQTLKKILPDVSPEIKLPKKGMQFGVTLDEFMKSYEIQYY